MNKTLASIFITLINVMNLFAGQPEAEKLPVWQEGEMEIHHIYTGRGEAVFCIFPDGTSMLIDAGDAGPHRDPRTTTASPDDSRLPGEWIARYILNRLEFSKVKKIDYAFLTHFHGDHMGGVYKNSPKTQNGGDYYLSGLTDVCEYISFSKLIDRDWPAYSNPVPQRGASFENYKKFVDWQHQNNSMDVERFRPGSNSQFVLLNQPEKYPEFEIRNIISSGEIWTGEGKNTRNLFPPGERLHENKLSAGIRISYGAFDYFNGGDLNGRIPFNSEQWRDVETPVGEVLGPVEVCEANHHAWIDAMNEPFLHRVKPQIIVIQVWHVTHLNLSVMQSMANKGLNPDLEHIIPTAVPNLSKAYLGEDQVKKLTGDGGHVVIKVEPGGEKYRVYLVNETDETFTVKSVYGPFVCR